MGKNCERETGVETLWRVPKIGRRLHRCNFYEADSLINNYHNTVLFEVSFAEAMRTSNGMQAACYFGSALCAFCPNLVSVVKNALEEYGMDLTVIKLPSGANDAGLKLDDYEKYDPIEISTLIGSWLIIIFKKGLKVDACIINKMVSGLAEELGVPDEKIPALKSHFQLPQVMAIRNAFCANIALKEDVKNFLLWLYGRKEAVATMARYVCLDIKYVCLGIKIERATGVDTLRVPKIGRRLHRCNFYEADSLVNDEINTVLFEVSFAEAMRTSNGMQAACYFGSALCAFCPNLVSVVKNALEEYGMDLTAIKLPSGADDAGLMLDDYEKYHPSEISTLIGSWLIIIFQKGSKVDTCIINKMVSGLAEELGVPGEKIPALKSHFQLPQVMAIRKAFCANMALKEDVKKFLFWLKERKYAVAASMARYIYHQFC